MSNVITLYRADTGAVLGRCDIGDGLRGKSWLEEIPRFLLEAATQRGLTPDGYGVLANFPAFLDGQKTQSRAIGEALTARLPAVGTQIFRCVPQTQLLGTGDNAALTFGSTALTQPDPSLANYFATPTAACTNLLVTPRGAQSPAFVSSDAAAAFNCAATDGTLTIVVNGATFVVTGLVGTAETAATVQAAIVAAGVPVRSIINATGGAGFTLIVASLGLGRTQNILVDNTAGTAGAVIFATRGGVTYFGQGGPLGQMDNSDSLVSGVKAQRRIRPLSLTVTCVMTGETVTSRELTPGVLTGANIAATATWNGVVNDVTGAIQMTATVDAPDNATAVIARYDALIPIDLHEEVKVPVGGMGIAILQS